MIYKKDPNVRYVDMCKYIDDHIYSGDYNERLVYEYLYHLSSMLAAKKRFFNTASDYDNFGLYCATRLMLRLVDPRQFLDDDNPKKLAKVDSILNYLKATLYPMKVVYQKQYFLQSFEDNSADIFDRESIKGHMLSQSLDSNKEMIVAEFKYYLSKITQTIKTLLLDSPYASDKSMINNIYISCLLTILNQVTLNKVSQEKLSKIKGNVKDSYIDELYAKEMRNSVILYHLDDTLENYIFVLVNKIKRLICVDLQQLLDSYQVPDSVVKSILASPLSEIVGD